MSISIVRSYQHDIVMYLIIRLVDYQTIIKHRTIRPCTLSSSQLKVKRAKKGTMGCFGLGPSELGDTTGSVRSLPSNIATLTQVLHMKWPTCSGSTRRGQSSTTDGVLFCLVLM